MSILIKGIEKPTSCESCPCKTADAFGGLGCQATGYIPLRKANQDRQDWCPLIEVPEPHGRLIDADALADQLGITDMDCDKCALGKIYGCGRGGDFEDACEAIEEAPTVIEAEKEQDSFKPKAMDYMHPPTISDCIKAYEDAYRVAKYRLCLLEEGET